MLGFSLGQPRTLWGLYVVTAIVVSAVFALSRALVRSKMGLVLTAARDQESRLQFLGYPVSRYKVFVFALAAMLTGLGGALYAPQVGIITPSQIGVVPSLEIVVWVAFGGRGTLLGALIGAIGVNAARSLLTTYYPDWWPIILGGLFMFVVLALPEGVVGLPTRLRRGVRALRERFVSDDEKGPTTVVIG